MEIEFDAADQLEQLKKENVKDFRGVSPELAALESLIYPKSEQISNNASLAASGKMEIVPPIGPLTLFVFGSRRVLPVKITQYQIKELAYDIDLNPILATVTITMSALTYNDLQQLQTAGRPQPNHLIKEEAAKSILGK
ncbi:MAG: hypothetical protein LBH74_07230 [Nitrososphaerota archaeon]|nr:hypothetical protein [Nitrososphaerota archaeon]